MNFQWVKVCQGGHLGVIGINFVNLMCQYIVKIGFILPNSTTWHLGYQICKIEGDKKYKIVPLTTPSAV